MPRDPYCRNCGYSLKGLTESSKCPECGRPLVEVLERERALPLGRRYKSNIVIFGLPLVHVALGPHENEKTGRACGIIAIGDTATGWLAIGGFARGIFAFGGMALGIVPFGGCSIGLAAMGGWAIGGFAFGGGAVGGIAVGGGAVGFIAQGGGAAGYYAEGGGVWGKHVAGPNRSDPEAKRLFSTLHQVIGAGPADGIRWCLAVLGWYLAFALLLALACVLLLGLGYARGRRRAPPPALR